VVSPVDGRRIDLVIATSTGGVGTHVRSLAAGLVERGAHVTVHGAADADALFGFSALGASFEPVDIAVMPTDRRVRRDPTADIRAVRGLRAAVADADIVHAHGLRAGVITGLAVPRRAGAPWVVVTWHNALLGSTARRRVLGVAERWLARRADVTIGASPDLVARAMALGARRAVDGPVAAPPLPPPTRSAGEVRASLGAADRPLVLAVGRLSAQKRFDVLIDAATRWSSRTPQPLVVIAGSGPTEDRLADQVAETGAPVRLLGRRDDVPDLLAAADVVVLPSEWEARALVAQEALRAGRPLVATAVGGVPDLVGDAAVLVPPGDPTALADAVAAVLDDETERTRLSAAGRARAASFTDESASTDLVVSVYSELLGGSR
jgi:glycosyltransferase involved in cell wall biosynthesis